ncbi:hypothetical protein BCR32DRAFT_96835 [Anaeromyces robustus]|jgi:hypothetical protein|uniref:Uncharacterized protein n=1 Tax=Anaeromyces robustus TaxID=1754192 RepID=A0A1Y1WNV0_9FUNG|nr:hypothetical protein BCR32DRAFT_96835 [Anaeromyces robustus]|eukprot:ORX75203.1 hypothetical protein BCR32DRAFT_96835 [Anaeromyces robustus]
MARGKNSQNYLLKRKRPNKNGSTDNVSRSGSSETIDVVLQKKYDAVESKVTNIAVKLFKIHKNKISMYVGIGALLLIFLILNYLERRITKYTYKYENIAEIKYKDVFNNHYNYKGKEAYETLTAMKEGGRKIYLIYNLVLIFIYSPFLLYSITEVINEVCGFTRANLAPSGIAIFQVLESIALIFTILGYPNTMTLLNLAGKLAVCKYFFIFFSVFVVIFGAIDRYQNKPKPGAPVEDEKKKENGKKNN